MDAIVGASSVRTPKPKSPKPSPPQDAYLMPKGDDLQLERGSASEGAGRSENRASTVLSAVISSVFSGTSAATSS
jgi:hypothetical protein